MERIHTAVLHTLVIYIQEAFPNFSWICVGLWRFSVVKRYEALDVLFLSLGWLIAATCIHLIYLVAIKSRDLEVYASKLDDISHSNDLLLVVREEVLKDFVDRTLLAD